MKKRNDDFYLSVLNLLKQGKNPSTISKELNIKKQNLNYYLSILKKKGIIKKVGYGTWEVKEFTSNTLTKVDRKIRGHAFIWTIKLNKQFDWINLLKTDYKLVRGLTPRIFIDKRKIWLGKKTLTIYESNSFYGKNAIESRKYAVISLIETLEKIEKLLNINLKPYIFNPAREHYALIKNDLARQCNRRGEKLVVSDLNGKWLWIDDSDGLEELEVGNTNALVNSIGTQKWWNDMKRTKFEVTPSFLMESLNKITENQARNEIQVQQFSKQISSHLQLIKEYRKENIAWRKGTIKEIKEEIKHGKQTKLFDFK
jgi:hypothetical protein